MSSFYTDQNRSSVKGRCENNDGKPARVDAFGHKFCWECYHLWSQSFKATQVEMETENKQMSLNY